MRSERCGTKYDNQVNDVVLVANKDTQRGTWPPGWVVEAKTSTNGLVRTAKYRINDKVEHRRINELLFLEYHDRHFMQYFLSSSYKWIILQVSKVFSRQFITFETGLF